MGSIKISSFFSKTLTDMVNNSSPEVQEKVRLSTKGVLGANTPDPGDDAAI